MSEYVIRTERLVKKFGDKTVLRHIDIALEEGEIFGLLGPSGAGKTTLIKILTGQLSYNEGTVHILGKEIKHLKKELLGRIGTVFDDSGVYERLNCYDNLKLFADIYGIRRSRIYEVLQSVGLSGEKKTPVMKLSKGMKQRLILARAILHEPPILFLDEPTSGLDPATAKQIHKLLQKIKSGGTTILLTTHNMEEAYKICDHVSLLNDGVIVEHGVPEELCRKYNKKKCVKLLLTNGEQREFAQNAACGEELLQLIRSERVETIHSSEPDLEQVFLELTGRSLMTEE